MLSRAKPAFLIALATEVGEMEMDLGEYGLEKGRSGENEIK